MCAVQAVLRRLLAVRMLKGVLAAYPSELRKLEKPTALAHTMAERGHTLVILHAAAPHLMRV